MPNANSATGSTATHSAAVGNSAAAPVAPPPPAAAPPETEEVVVSNMLKFKNDLNNVRNSHPHTQVIFVTEEGKIRECHYGHMENMVRLSNAKEPKRKDIFNGRYTTYVPINYRRRR